MGGWVDERERKIKQKREDKRSRGERRKEQGILLERKRQEGREGERGEERKKYSQPCYTINIL